MVRPRPRIVAISDVGPREGGYQQRHRYAHTGGNGTMFLFITKHLDGACECAVFTVAGHCCLAVVATTHTHL